MADQRGFFMFEWIDVNDRLPEIDPSAPDYARCVRVLASWGGNPNCVAEMLYAENSYAKTEKGRKARFVWQGRNSPWAVTHWALMPKGPEKS